MPTPAADPWSQFLPKQAQPKRDYGTAPWSDVAVRAAQGLIPSYAKDTWDSITGLAKHLTAPPTGGTAASANEPVTMGLMRSLADATLGTHTQSQTTGADFAKGAGEYLGSRYGSVPAFKRTLANDPGSVLMDAQAAATIPEGGEGLVTRVPGIAGDALRTGARAAGTFNKVTNPVALGGAGLKTVATAGRTAIRGGPVVDRTGAFTPAVHKAVQQAFPKGEVTPADLQNPGFKTQLTQTLQAKGITPAAVKEATLAYHTAPTPASVVTRTRPAPNVADTVEAARTQGHAAVADRMHSIVGGPPDPSVLGASVEQAHDQSLAAAGQNYTDLKKIPGSFGPALNGPDLSAHIGARLASKDMPSTPALLERSASAYPEANAALKTVNDSLVKGETRLGGEITTPEIAEVRRQLTGNLSAAKGSDATAVGAIIDGLHDHLESTSAQGQFVGPNGPVDISGQLKTANAAYKQHFDTFGNSQGPARLLKGTVNSIKGSDLANVGDADAHLAASKNLVSNLANPTQGPATYSLLKNALTPDGQAALDDYVRKSTVLNPDGSPVKPAKLRAGLNGPSGTLFSPQEQSDLRLGAAAQDVLDAKLPPGAAPQAKIDMGSVIRHGVGAAAGAAAGALAAPILPHLPFAEAAAGAVGGLGGGMAEGIVEPYFQGRAISKQLAGAPAAGNFLNGPADIGRFTQAGAPAIPVIHGLEGAEPKPKAVEAPTAPVSAPEIDLSSAPGPFDAAPAPQPIPAKDASGKDPWAKYQVAPPPKADASQPPSDDDDLSAAPGPFDAPVARASGGKVDDPEVERLVARLQALAKHAKRATKKATEPLLKVPDAAITRALDVAQKAI